MGIEEGGGEKEGRVGSSEICVASWVARDGRVWYEWDGMGWGGLAREGKKRGE